MDEPKEHRVGLESHGRMGKSEVMKSHKTNLEAVEPPADKPEHPDTAGKRPHKPEIRLGREAQARIGELLRAMYNTYVNQGVPQHLAELVRRLGDES
jgi:Anti-sigma factor NepR